LIKQNQEFKELLVEQQKDNQDLQKQLLEAVKDVKHVTNNNVNSNNKFNLNFFLNEQCKDAMNISEFLENMQLDMEDLLETGRLGYVNGISRIFINKLRELDTYKRPLHCTDLKRETLYIRDNDVWEKEENSKDTLRKLVDKVANKNCKTMKQWTAENPNYTEMDTIENEEFMKLSTAILGGFGEWECKQFRDKIIRNVIKEVLIAKHGL
jgi:SAM-dependent MidA family methyltransferase